MKHRIIKNKSKFSINTSVVGQPLTDILERAITTKEPIDTSVGKVEYTERKDGVNPAHNIRTDKMDLALEATDKVTKAYAARRKGLEAEKEEKAKAEAEKEARREKAIQKIMENEIG